MMGWYDNGWMNGFGMLMMLLIWGGLIALGIWAVARLTRSSPTASPVETPRQILDRRFAAGEINAEEYAETRHILEGRIATGSTPRA
ncbi:MAG: SHOCT domain-containing protein [Actinomycetia bacterium]|nr:SHOCT domain-containing protein [Actinomycetes bacterium]